MRLLIITQKIDQHDDLLGFMHGWIIEFAKHCDRITAIALGVGQYNLPDNVRVFSLGKEKFKIENLKFKIAEKFIYLTNFYRYIWHERKNYDCVFVHMNQEYAILGGLFWRFAGKRVALWRNHQAGGFWVRVAAILSHKIFYTSRFAFVAKHKKAQIMPVGVDINIFKPRLEFSKIPRSILFLGRLSPIKKPDILVESLNLLKKDGIVFRASIIGNAPARDKLWREKIKQKIKEYNLNDCVELARGIPHWQTPEIYNQHEIFINLTSAGSLDKTIFEAMACGNLVLISNRSLFGQIDQRFFFTENDPQDLARKLKEVLSLSAWEKEGIMRTLRNFVIQKHSLDFLVKQILENL